MNSLPQQALDRAREKPASKLLPKILAIEPMLELAITGPINRVMELEVKHWTLDFVQGLGASIRRGPVRTKAIADLHLHLHHDGPARLSQPSIQFSGHSDHLPRDFKIRQCRLGSLKRPSHIVLKRLNLQDLAG